MNTSVSIRCSALAWLLWAMAGACVLLEFLLPPQSGVVVAAVLFVGGAATLHVKTFVADTFADMREREANAFELGRDSVRSIR